MIIEFLGESGCGKSTLAEELFPLFENSATKGSLNTRDNIKAFIHVMTDNKVGRLYRSIVRLNISVNGLSRLIKDCLYLAGVCNILITDQKCDRIWIIDQGILQYLFRVYFYVAPENDRYKAIIKDLFDNFDIYSVNCFCDYNTLKKRINKRQNDANEVPRRIENASEDLIALHSSNLNLISSSIPNGRFIDIDTAENKGDNANRIRDFVFDIRG